MKNPWRKAKATEAKRIGVQKTDKRSASPLPSTITIQCVTDRSRLNLSTAGAVASSCPGCGTLYRYVHPHIETRPADAAPAVIPAPPTEVPAVLAV